MEKNINAYDWFRKDGFIEYETFRGEISFLSASKARSCKNCHFLTIDRYRDECRDRTFCAFSIPVKFDHQAKCYVPKHRYPKDRCLPFRSATNFGPDRADSISIAVERKCEKEESAILV